MIFALQYENTIKFAVYRANRVNISDSRSVDKWEFRLKGFDLVSTWDHLFSDIFGIELLEGKKLDEIIIQNELRDKVRKQLEILENKAMIEKQPRRKWELVEEINKLKEQLEGV